MRATDQAILLELARLAQKVTLAQLARWVLVKHPDGHETCEPAAPFIAEALRLAEKILEVKDESPLIHSIAKPRVTTLKSPPGAGG